MRTLGMRWGGALFALLVAGGLSFGASSVLAQPAGSGACPFSPPDLLGACTSSGVAGCTLRCQQYGAVQGDCPNGCCVCIF